MILTGDSLKKLRTLPSESVQMCVTSPPYWGLRAYGTNPQVWGGEVRCRHEWMEHIQPATDGTRTLAGNSALRAGHQGTTSATMRPKRSDFCALCGAWRGELGLEPTLDLYVSHLVEVFREVRRVLRKDATLWLNLGDSYATGAGKACSPGGGKQGENFQGPKGYRGAHDASPKHSMKQVPETKNPCAGIPTFQPNRMPQPGLKAKDLCMIPARVALALQADGWYLRSDIIWHKPNPMPESVTDRPTKSHEYMFLLSKSAKYFYDADAVREPFADERMGNPGGGGNYLRTCPRPNGVVGSRSGLAVDSNWTRGAELGGRNRRSVWTISTKPYKGAHFATFPPKLIEPCILAGSRPGDVVLDPFAGAFTTPLVAQLHGRDFIAIELNAAYVALGKARLAAASPAPLKRTAAA